MGKKLLLMLGGLVVALLLAEGLVRALADDPLADQRFWHPATSGIDTPACVRPVRPQGYEYIPGRCGTNSAGLHDRERDLTRRPGEWRLLVLGDSISERKLYPDLLEVTLSARLDRPVTVLNAAISGYATANEAGLLRARVDEFDPDAVLVQTCLNDYVNTPVLVRHDDRQLFLHDEGGELATASPFWLDHSALYRFVLLRWIAAGHVVGPFADRARNLERALRDLAGTAQTHDLPLLIVVFPLFKPLAGYTPGEQQTYVHIIEALRQLRLPGLDLQPALAEAGISQLRIARGPALHQRLDEALAAHSLPAEIVENLKAASPASLLVSEEWISESQGFASDVIHPNFLGYALAARETADYLLAHEQYYRLRQRP